MTKKRQKYFLPVNFSCKEIGGNYRAEIKIRGDRKILRK